MAYDPATNETILFGGAETSSSGIVPLGDTWSYNGSVWTELSPRNSPSPRAGAAITYDPSSHSLILFGGISVANGKIAVLNDTWSWDGHTWIQLSPSTSPPPRGGASFAYDSVVGAGILFGGMNNNSVPFDDTWEWNGSNWVELGLPISPPARADAAMAYDSSAGQLVLFGGLANEGAAVALGDTWIFNGVTWSQVFTSATPSARFGAVAAYDANLNLTILYGGSSTFEAFPGSGDTWGYDSSTESWKVLASLPAIHHKSTSAESTPNFQSHQSASSPMPTLGAGFTYDSTAGELILFAGYSGNGQTVVSGVSTLAPQSSPVENSVSSQVSGQPIETPQSVATSTWFFNGGWSQQPNVPSARSASNLVSIDMPTIKPRSGKGSKGILLFGGQSGSGVPLNDTWFFDGTNWIELSPANSPPPRYGASASVATVDINTNNSDQSHNDSGGRSTPTKGIFLFGGQSASGVPLNDTWFFDGTNWIELSPANSPPPRYGQSSTSLFEQSITGGGDPKSNHELDGNGESKSSIFQNVIFGGIGPSSSLYEDMWGWTGSNWVQFSAQGLPALSQASIEFDRSLHEIVIFGGSISQGYQGGQDATWLLPETSKNSEK